MAKIEDGGRDVDATQAAEAYLRDNPDLREALEMFRMSAEQYAEAIAGLHNDDRVLIDSSTSAHLTSAGS